MPDALKRAMLGFAVAALSVLTFHAAAWEAFHLFGLMPPPYPMRAVPPFGVPQIISVCFWGGVWGVLFGLVLPTLPMTVPMWPKGLALGVSSAIWHACSCTA